ncbi:UDP-N-acetylglucosamine 2-epimerase (non-hydrolyzing) [Acidobacteria bacterium AH-259-A15]|nr:UDP-N-acetylglucosamine 2-epimerase (non-hydrolyzing) [Acidobacteria bacterium AH-259-A15]
MHILHVVGARPNFMKAAPLLRVLAECDGVRQTLVHTGQHYDKNMSELFFQQLGLPEPEVNLEVGSGSHAAQTGQIMISFEPVLLERKPDLVLVYGDVNSTVAAALVCSKLGVPVGHIEAGLRSFDRTMPEEINRLLTDQVADLLFTPSEDGNENLEREGVSSEKVHFVGNAMIDTLKRLLPLAEKRSPLKELGIEPKNYGLVTLHRPPNVDDPTSLLSIIEALEDISRDITIIFPVHPRTRRSILKLNLSCRSSDLHLIEPLGYLNFLSLQQNADFVITDSGGIQEETTYLNVPCLTVRENTERPVTVTLGTNVLVGQDLDRLRSEVARITDEGAKSGKIPPLWDGRTGERIADVICRI